VLGCRPCHIEGILPMVQTVGLAKAWQVGAREGSSCTASLARLSTALTSTSNRLGCWPLVMTGVVLFFHSWLSRLTSSKPLVGVEVPIAMTGGERPGGRRCLRPEGYIRLVSVDWHVFDLAVRGPIPSCHTSTFVWESTDLHVQMRGCMCCSVESCSRRRSRQSCGASMIALS